MPDYRRYFFTIVTYRRRPIFGDQTNVELFRDAIRTVKRELPFDINAAVVLPDHIHFLWTLPRGDDAYSKAWGA